MPKTQNIPMAHDKWGINFPHFTAIQGQKNINRAANAIPTPMQYLENAQFCHPVFRWLKAYSKPMKYGLMEASHKPSAKGMCYAYNHHLLRLSHNFGHETYDDHAYTEGLAISPHGGYLHAWSLLGGRVYDSVFRDGRLCDYLGVSFTPDFVRFMGFTTGHFCAFVHPPNFVKCSPYLENYGRNWQMPT